jgi:GMP synthase PP-ATPase subunit
MTNKDKREFIYSDITKNYNEFIRQSKIKLDYRFAPERDSHIELVSDVLFSILDKLDKREDLDRYYEMAVDNTLFNYICKAINTNCKSLNAPFLYNRLKTINRYVYYEEFTDVPLEDEDDVEVDYRKIAELILESFEPPLAKKIYGAEWRLYVKIYRDYIEDNKATYGSIAKKYNIPYGSLARNMAVMKQKIKKYLKDEKIC